VAQASGRRQIGIEQVVADVVGAGAAAVRKHDDADLS
jgi:hypothetical protein